MTLSDFMDKATETFTSVIVVNQTTYNIQDHWLKLAAHYFNIDTSTLSTDSALDATEDKLSLLKAGLFGYFNEISSSEIKSAVYYKNTIYDEHFLNTASFPESIMNHAKLYNVEMSNAKPSHMKVNMVIERGDLLNSSLREEITDDQYVNIRTMRTYQIILKRDYQFTIGIYKFKLPYDVQILLKQQSIKSDDYTITAKYLTDKNKFPFIDINSPEIKVFQDINGAEKYVYFQLDIYQLNTINTTFTVASEDITDNLFYTVPYTDQLANFNVYYTYEGQTYSLVKYFNNTYNPVDPDEKYCYYTYVDDDKLQISFSSIANSFRPRYNSVLKVEVETTKGQSGNFKYSDQILFNFSDDSDTSFSPMTVQVFPIDSNTSGGQDKLTTNQEKQKIIEHILTRDNLIMDSDLENYFDNINNNDSYNNSSMTFLKKRDDVLQRLYSSFLLMRDDDKKVIPSNTAPFSDIRHGYFSDNDFDRNGTLVIPEHSLFMYDNNATNHYVFQERKDVTDTDIQNAIKDRNNLLYINPFLTKIETKPSLKATYYKLDIDQDENMNYTYLNDLSDKTLLINKIHIEKENNFNTSVISDTWDINFNLNTSSTITQLTKDNTAIKIRGILVNSNTGKKYGYFEFRRNDPVNNPTLYSAKLSTNRTFENTLNEGSLLQLKNSLYDSKGEAIDEVAFSQDIVIKIGILIRDKDHTLTSNADSNEVKLYLNDEFPSNETIMEDGSGDLAKIGDYSLVVSVSSIDNIHLYRDLSNIMTSIVSRTLDTNDNWNSGENYFNEDINNLLIDHAKTWVAINDELKQVDQNTGQATFTDQNGKSYNVKVIGASIYRWIDNKLYKMTNNHTVDMNKDFSQDKTTDRVNGIICAVDDGIYIPRYDLTFTTVNNIKYIVMNSSKHQGLYFVKDDGYHKLLHNGNMDVTAINTTVIDPGTKTIVAFYDGIYQVSTQDGSFTDVHGDNYQITKSGLYKLENHRRYSVVSAYNVDRSQNNPDDKISVLRPNGLYAVLHDNIYQSDQYGLISNASDGYKYRVIPSGSYNGIYQITNDGNAIYRDDILGLTTISKNYKDDANFPSLVNIWSGVKPEDPNSGLLNLPTIQGNDNAINMYNAIINAENKNGYDIQKLVGNGAFSNYVPEENKDFRIELIPLISFNYFQYNYDYIYKLLDSYITILLSIVQRLENNTTIDLKFTNSFGPSNYWYLAYENSKAGKVDKVGNPLEDYNYHYISRTNFLYDFTIHVFEAIDDTVDARIKQFISDFVEASNSDGVIAVSNLQRLLEENFDLIRYIEFNGLSGRIGDSNDNNNDINALGDTTITNKYQKIQNRAVDLLDMTIDEVRYYVPEYMNIKKELSDNTLTVERDDGTMATVVTGKKYDYVINITYTTA